MSRVKSIPTILVDNRENLDYKFEGYNIPTSWTTLDIGDYSIGIQKGDTFTSFASEIAIERKTLDNFTGDLTENRGRFEESVKRGSLLKYYCVFIEASEMDIVTHKYTSQMLPQSAINTAIRWSVKYKVPIIFCGNRQNAEYHTYQSLIGFLEYKKKEII